MIGANFEIAEEGVTRVGWIQSDGSSYINLDHKLDYRIDYHRRDYDNYEVGTWTGEKFELDAIWPTYPASSAPGTILGATTSQSNFELDTSSTLVQHYRGVNDKALRKFWANGAETSVTSSTIDGYTVLQEGEVSTDDTGTVTEFRANTGPFGRSASNGALVWLPSFYAGKGVSVKKTLASESMSEQFDWGGAFTVTLDLQNLRVTIYDDAKDTLFYEGSYVAPTLRETYATYENPVIRWKVGGCTYTDAWHFGSYPSGAVNPFTGHAKRILFDGVGECIQAEEWMEYTSGAWQKYDRAWTGCAVPTIDCWPAAAAPNASLFLFARNNALSPENIDSLTKVRRLKIFDGGGNCTIDFVAARKTGVGAGLYDILSGKFVGGSGGTILYGG